MRKTAVIFAMLIVGLTFMSCSKESSAEKDTLYETQATEGDTGSDHDGRGKG